MASSKKRSASAIDVGDEAVPNKKQKVAPGSIAVLDQQKNVSDVEEEADEEIERMPGMQPWADFEGMLPRGDLENLIKVGRLTQDIGILVNRY